MFILEIKFTGGFEGIVKLLKNHHYLCYQYYKYGPDCLLRNLGIRDCEYEPYFLAKRKSLSCQIKMKTMFRNNDETKRRKYDTFIQNTLIIPDGSFQTNIEFFVLVHPINSCE